MNEVELYFGKGLFSPKLHASIVEACNFRRVNEEELGLKCMALLAEMRAEVGPHNVYNIYDNCENTVDFLNRVGKDQAWLTSILRNNMHNSSGINRALIDMNGGFKWDCGGDVSKWIKSAEAMKALHLDHP